MKSLLAPQNRPALRRLARGRVLLAFDFDGTLAPIVADPARAHLRPSTRRLLIEVARKYPCVVISGRNRADVASRLTGIPLRRVLGNHGIEPSPALPAARRAVRRWLACLKPRLERVPGLSLMTRARPWPFTIASHAIAPRPLQRSWVPRTI